jgi:hypothetical protein
MASSAARPSTTRNQGCLLATLAALLACILLVIVPAIYGFSRYRAAQVYSGSVPASNQPVTLPTQRADTYTLTLQPQVNQPGGVTVAFTLSDSFGRVLASNTNFYSTGCPSFGPATQPCQVQSLDFTFHNSLGGPVTLTVQATQPGISMSVQVRDEDAGGIFASGSLVVFGAVLGCGSLLWVACAAIIGVVFRRAQRSQRQTKGQHEPGSAST